jgi:hypothetical protein
MSKSKLAVVKPKFEGTLEQIEYFKKTICSKDMKLEGAICNDHMSDRDCTKCFSDNIEIKQIDNKYNFKLEEK